MGLSKKTQDEFIELLTSLRKNKVSVTYIDHHDIDPNVVKALEKIKVKVIHDINECTTVQVYNAFKSKLNEHASFVATCAVCSTSRCLPSCSASHFFLCSCLFCLCLLVYCSGSYVCNA